MLLIKVPAWLVIFLKGLLMGSADIVPGVSGGTMALITGIYERFVSALSSINFGFITLGLRGDGEGARESWRSIDWAMLVPLFVGIGTAMVIFARVFGFLLDDYAGPTFAFFFGLIVASAGFISKYIDRIDIRHFLSVAIGFLVVLEVIVLYRTQDTPINSHALPILLIAGAIAVCAMILPGISGSLTLLVMGQYSFFIDSLNGWDWRVLASFGSGAVVGILAFSRALNHMLDHHRSMTMAFLFGCMLGALAAPGWEIHSSVDLTSAFEVGTLIIAGIIGFLLVFVLERRSDRIKEQLGIDVV